MYNQARQKIRRVYSKKQAVSKKKSDGRDRISTNPFNAQKELTPFEQSLEDIKCGKVTRIKNVSNRLEECMQ
jgi:hypothetical protein